MASVQSSTVDIATGDGTCDADLLYPDDGAPRPGVLLYMDAFGPRPALRTMAARLAGAGYTVLVPNVFYREGPAPVADLPGFIDPAARPEIFAVLGPKMQALTPDRAVRDAGAYLGFLAAQPQTAEGPAGTVGYCMGAALALRTAAAFPDRVAAAAGFHGGNLATEDPDSPHRAAGGLGAGTELYFGHADADPALPPEQIERLDAALTAAGVRFTAEVYPGAGHGYTQADTASYHPDAAERHWKALLDLFGRTL